MAGPTRPSRRLPSPGDGPRGDVAGGPGDDDLRRPMPTVGFDDGRWAPIAVPGHWRSHAGVRRRATARCSTAGASSTPRPDRTTAGCGSPSTASSTKATSGSTAPTSATPRATSPRTRSRSPSSSPGATSTSLAIEVTCSPAARQDGQAQPHRRVPALGLPRRHVEPGRHLAAGARSRRPARSASATSACCAARPADRAGRGRPAGQPRDRRRRDRSSCARGSAPSTTSSTQPLAAGENHVEWTVTIEQPALWWPWSLGDQPLHDVVVEVAPAEAPDELSHRRDVPHRPAPGRAARLDLLASTASACYLKGSNHGPTRQALAEATPDEFAADVRLAKEAGLDLLRVHAHVTRPELYDAADEAGLLLWQDLPLQWGYARSVRKQAIAPGRRRGAPPRPPPVGRDLVRPQRADRHRHHRGRRRAQRPGEGRRPVLDRHGAADVQPHDPRPRPSPGRSARPTAPARHPALGRAGRTCPSSTAPTPTSTSAGTTATSATSPGSSAAVPRMARFVTEFGAQSDPRRRPTSASPSAGPTSTGTAHRAAQDPEVASSTSYVPPGRLRDLRRVARRRRSATRRW